MTAQSFLQISFLDIGLPKPKSPDHNIHDRSIPPGSELGIMPVPTTEIGSDERSNAIERGLWERLRRGEIPGGPKINTPKTPFLN